MSYKRYGEVKAHKSQRPKRPELKPISLAWPMTRSIATPAWTGCKCITVYVTGTHSYTWVKRDKVAYSALSKENTATGEA